MGHGPEDLDRRSSATVKSRLPPETIVEATAMAEQEDAPSAAIAIRISNRRTSSSSTNARPGHGGIEGHGQPGTRT